MIKRKYDQDNDYLSARLYLSAGGSSAQRLYGKWKIVGNE